MGALLVAEIRSFRGQLMTAITSTAEDGHEKPGPRCRTRESTPPTAPSPRRKWVSSITSIATWNSAARWVRNRGRARRVGQHAFDPASMDADRGQNPVCVGTVPENPEST